MIKYTIGKLPNRRAGFDHLHSGMSECGMAYRDSETTWLPCSKYVNHPGDCGFADNTAF